MKSYYLLLGFWWMSFTLSAQSTGQPVTWYSHIKLKQIPATIGMPFLIKQHSTAEINSVFHASRYFFENATIGKIKSCKLDFAVRNDTVQSITIYLTGQKNYNAAMKQAQKEFGHAVVVMDENADIYTWLAKNQSQEVLISLVRKNQEWGSEMIIKGNE